MAKNAMSGPLSRFPLATDETRKRIIAVSQGEIGSGKTHFWCSAPGPIVIQSFDRGTEGVIEQFVRQGKEIHVVEYDWHPTEDLTQDEAIELRDHFIEDFELAIQHARTVLWDKETDAWEVFRYAEFGGPSDAPRNYPALNQRYRRYVNMPKSFDINFGLIQSMGDRWVSKPDPKTGVLKGYFSGEREPRGFGELEGLAHISLFHRRERGRFYIDVGKSRGPGGQSVQDTTLEGIADSTGISFSEFAQLVFPESDESDWL